MKITKTRLKQIIKEELEHVLNEREGLGPEVAGFVEKAIAALTVLKEVGFDMGKFKFEIFGLTTFPLYGKI